MGRSQTPIEHLGLGSRAEKALHRLGIATAGKLLSLDPSKVLGLPGCGSGVYMRLISAQKRLSVTAARNAREPKDPAATFRVLRHSLGSWAQRCLGHLAVRSLPDLAAVRFCEFLALDGFGLSTWNEIAAVRRSAIESLGGIVVGGQKKIVRQPVSVLSAPPTASTLEVVPLFSGLEPALFGTPQYHAEWKATWKITDLALSVRAYRLCARAGIRNLGQLLMVPSMRFLEERNSHVGTLTKVLAVARELLLGGLEAKGRRVEYRSFRSMLASWVSLVLHDTFVPVVTRRFDVENGRFVTYERIAGEFSITRARVGQIWEAARTELRRRQHLAVLDRFWGAVEVESANADGDLERLGAALAKQFRWQEAPAPVALREVLNLKSGF